MVPSVAVGEITPDLGQWMTNQVLERDKSILSAMLVDAGGIVLGHKLRDNSIEPPSGEPDIPLALPLLGGRMFLFLRVAGRGRPGRALSRASEFFAYQDDYIVP